ncbi:MAG: PAS domain S-box protein [Methylobacter sp.]|nr:MAG: PAS domain S-box protein [Methylobacter sp.]
MPKDNHKFSFVCPVANPRYSVLALQIIGLALAYSVTGKLGTFLAIPPGYATAIWPASGIALAGILIYGYRIWPGILLGAFLVNFSNALVAGSLPEILTSIIITLAMSVGASLQAVAGVYLVHRYAGFPNSLTREKDVLLFFLFGGILSTLINSTISVSALVLTERIPTTNFLTSWGTWWMGDALGVFIFTPLVLVWMQRSSEFWRNRRIAITLPIIAMFVLTTVGVFYVSQHDSERLESEFNRHAAALKVALEESVLAHINVLRSINSFYSASASVERDEFRIFAAHLLTELQGIQALEWSPVVHSFERDAFEKNLSREGYPKFTITERDNNQVVRAGNRPEYVPVSFVEPLQGNDKALGYDLYSNDIRREAINRARDSGEITLSAQLGLIQEQGGQYGLLAFMPVYRNGLPHQTLMERRNHILGYLVEVFRAEDIVTAAFEPLDRENLSYRLIDETVPAAEQVVFSSAPKAVNPVSLQEKGLFGRNFSLASRSVISVGGRSWRFEVFPTLDYFAHHRSDNIWLILLAGMMLNSMVSVFVMVSSGRGRLLLRLVEERTAALVESENRLQCALYDSNKSKEALENVLFAATDVSIIATDADGLITMFNRGAELMLGYSSDEMLAKQTPAIIHLAEEIEFRGHELTAELGYPVSGFEIFVLRARQSGQETREWTYVRKDGSQFRVMLVVTPIRDAQGEVSGYLGIAQDITEQYLAQNALEKSEIKLRRLFELSPLGIVMTDMSGRFIEFNEAFRRICGYSSDELKSIDYWTLTPKKYESMEMRQLQSLRQIGRYGPYEKEYQRKDGAVIPLRLNGVLVKGTDNNNYIWSIVEDISASKEVEEALRQAKLAADNANRAKGEFLANMSHEIRTPMNAIIGLSYLALNKEISPENRDYLEKIYSASNSLLSILNDILDFSKLEAGRLTIENNPFDLDDILDTIRNLFVDRAKEKRLDFNIDVATDVPRNLIGDTLRLQQVLINLLGNAIKFTEQGQVALKITVRKITSSQVRLLFCVTDTGIGMSDSDLEKLFHPFSQVDGSITRRFGGTGLGLVISRNLLQLMGSEFSVASALGKGSSFSFELVLGVSLLSCQRKPGISISTPEDFGKLLVGARVLVAEDNLINQQVIREFLNLSGIAVEIANDGNEALALLENGVFDAVLMDMHMPGMDGFAATKLIRSQVRFCELPVIALTAGVSNEEYERCMALGMNDFIAKPINPKKLMWTLVQWIKPVGATATDAIVAESSSVKLFGADDLPGFDLHNLLDMIGNNQELAIRLLFTFMESMKHLPGEIEAMVTAENWASAGELVHKIKGTSGTIGAVRLYAASDALEAELKNELSAATFDSFRAAFDQTMSVIAALCHPVEPMQPNDGNSEALQGAATELELLLKGNDFVSDSLLNTLKPHLRLDQLDLFARLRTSVNGLQYDEARKILRQLAELPDTQQS